MCVQVCQIAVVCTGVHISRLRVNGGNMTDELLASHEGFPSVVLFVYYCLNALLCDTRTALMKTATTFIQINGILSVK